MNMLVTILIYLPPMALVGAVAKNGLDRIWMRIGWM
jgi:hypothetical protein